MTTAFLKTETLSEISRDIAQVLFAALFIEPIASGNISVLPFAFGFLSSCGAWVISLLLAKV